MEEDKIGGERGRGHEGGSEREGEGVCRWKERESTTDKSILRPRSKDAERERERITIT